MTKTETATVKLPAHRGLYYGGGWRAPVNGLKATVENPANGQIIADVDQGDAADVDAIVAAARAGFALWRRTSPLERVTALRRMAEIIRQHADELALLDAIDCGSPINNMKIDVMAAAGGLEFFAGLITEMKGDSIPVGADAVNFTVREPRGVVLRIVPFNHPLLFTAVKAAAPLAAGNSVIVKPAEQAPLSSLRLAELLDGVLPPGVFNVVPGGRELAAGLVAHRDVAMVGLVGSVPTGRAVMRGAADTIKPVLLELGGKNALIALPDADPARVAAAVIAGMNFTWSGQSCGSTSRAFLHASIHDEVVGRLAAAAAAFEPGDPTDPATTMGALVSRQHYERVLSYIAAGKAEGARMLCGGAVEDNPALANGYFVRPTIFADVKPSMTIAREEIFGPVLSVLKWDDEAAMLNEVNDLEYGLTCSIWTNDLIAAHRLAGEVEAGYVWINEVSRHIRGAPFGGYKQSGVGREGGLEELFAFTQEKNLFINLAR